MLKVNNKNTKTTFLLLTLNRCFSYEFCDVFNNTFFYKIFPVAASASAMNYFRIFLNNFFLFLIFYIRGLYRLVRLRYTRTSPLHMQSKKHEKIQSMYQISLDLLGRLSIRTTIIPNKFEFEDEFETFSEIQN